MVTPFHPLRIAPLGELKAFFRPISFTWVALGVMVGSLNIDPDKWMMMMMMMLMMMMIILIIAIKLSDKR